MDKKFLVIVENAIDKEISNWWENDNATEYDAKVFEGFEDAKKCPSSCSNATIVHIKKENTLPVKAKYNPKTNKYDAPNGGNDIAIPWDVVVARVKPANSKSVKWAHFIKNKGMATI